MTRDIASPVRNSRLGEAYRELAVVLSSAGHDVSILYAAPEHCEDRSLKEWIKSYENEGIKLVPLPEADVSLDAPPSVAISYRCYQWLKARPFDIVHFHAWQGIGYYSLLAHHQGLALQDALLCVELHDFWLWHKLRNFKLVDDIDDLCIDFMEQQSVLLADYVVSPSEHIMRWMEEKGMRLPKNLLLLQDLLPASALLNTPSQNGSESGTVSVVPGDTKQTWVGWHNYLSEIVSSTKSSTEKEPPPATPMVSVCLVHYNRPKLLRQAIESLENQDSSNFEIILVDDGSSRPDALAYLDEIKPKFNNKGWKIIRQENKYLGAARNTAARHARGKYLLFMDDDDYAKPDEISLFTYAAEHTGAGILTAGMDIFRGESVPNEETEFRRWLPLGGALALGAIVNRLGSSNAFWRRETFLKLGGYTEDYGTGHEDWELYAKALFQGVEMQIVPESLFWYRASDAGMASTTVPGWNMLRNLRPYLEVVPDKLRNTLILAYGMHIRHDRLKSEHEALKQQAQKLEELLNRTFDSRSWRLTKPLRYIDRRLRKWGLLKPREQSTHHRDA